MRSQLQQALSSLCLNTGWKYAVFWKLKHQARMMFTWEDAYYDSSGSTDHKWQNSTVGSFSEGPHSHDPLGLVVAKMSREAYSLGEGIVGKVAVSGKHSWICSDQYVTDSSSPSENCGGLQIQFSAGIKTIVVVAIIPYGIVQLGSLHKIAEDMKMVDHIRNIVHELQDPLAGCIPRSMNNQVEGYCLSDTCTRISDSTGPDSLARLKSPFHDEDVNLWSQLYLPLVESGNCSPIISPLWGVSNKTFEMNIHGKAGGATTGNQILHPSSSENILGQEEVVCHDNAKYGGEADEFKDLGKVPEIASTQPVKNVWIDKCSSSNLIVPTDESQMAMSNFPSDILDSPLFHGQDIALQNPQNHHSRFGQVELPISPFRFSAGYELYEALGPAFQKQNDIWGTQETVSDMAIEISEGMGSFSMLPDNFDAHLLDAVVATVSCKGNDRVSDKSCLDTGESHLTAEKVLCTSVTTYSSAGYSFDKDTSSSLNSVIRGVESFRGFSSPSSSRGSEHLERAREGVKISKKRARPGESGRPRPRDRQLIQDRIKELRELVPSGSKCSIDSLLERTIKHMLYLQSITKHAEKLIKCSATKLLDKDTGMRRFSCHEQGSSWAMEVGNDQKVFPIIVENVNMNGQMLVEMLCEECVQFLEIAEAIRNLGLTILKGISEAHGTKTWMCFVVEVQNNRSMHRMDVLWSLMQLLQPKTAG